MRSKVPSLLGQLELPGQAGIYLFDDLRYANKEIIYFDFVLWASLLEIGLPSALRKKRLIPSAR